ncbi:MAG: RNA polymerase sigma factor [Bacteroidales bacterium]|nr:RNA polymerase sigma factor [Bacteroidales bacterium]
MNKAGDIELIDRILHGEVSGFAILVDRYKDMAFTVAYRIIDNREDAEEIAQDAFLKAYRNLKQFRGKSKFSTWLYRIVYNTAVSKKRLRKIQVTSLEEVSYSDSATYADPEVESRNGEEEKASLLERAFTALAEDERTIISLYYLNDSSIDEIRNITGLSAANVKVKLFRARKKMQVVISGNSHVVYA